MRGDPSQDQPSRPRSDVSKQEINDLPEDIENKHLDQLQDIDQYNSLVEQRLSETHGLICRKHLDILPAFQHPEDFVDLEVDYTRRMRLAQILSVRHRSPEDIQQAMLSLLATAYRLGIPFLYILTGKPDGIELLLGLYEDDLGASVASPPSTRKTMLAGSFDTLLTALPGFLPGCELRKWDAGETEDVLEFLSSLSSRQIVTGIPSEKGKPEGKPPQHRTVQGLEALVDALSETFAIVTFARPVDMGEIEETQGAVSRLHDEVHEYVKKTSQLSHANQAGGGVSVGATITDQKSHSDSATKTEGRMVQPNIIDSTKQNIRTVVVGGAKPHSNMTEGYSSTDTISSSSGKTINLTRNQSFTVSQAETLERTSKRAQYVEELLGRLHKRLDVGRGLGMWHVVTQIYSDKEPHVQKVSTVLAGLVSGPESSLDPIRTIPISGTVSPIRAMDQVVREEHPLGRGYSNLSTLLTTQELGLLTRLPAHELPGLPVERLTEYGRSQLPGKQSHSIPVGLLVDREIPTSRKVHLDKDQLQRHCFVTGATGSGKSNTMRHLLTHLWNKLNIPFLVIEPIKGEYRHLRDALDGGIQVYTLGKENNDFSLNPFDFEPEVGLVPHIDHLKAVFNASLGMYSSMPFILEDIVYRVYQRYGWSLETGENPLLNRSARVLGNSDTATLRSFFLPRLSDLAPLVDSSISRFFPAATDYGGSLTGALKARLSSLTRGAKGALLDRRGSSPFDKLLEKPCVLELWPFSDNDEKAFVMALVLMRLYEHRQQSMLQSGETHRDLRHILVIEEAHRLLAKPSPTGEHSAQGRQKGVEVFADILAEIRSYGQGIVIVDQIPSKLIPDVLRNTDVKIAHRLVDKEDRQILGATMNLDEEQMQDLARAQPGRASIYFGGLRRALRIQVKQARLASGASSSSASNQALDVLLPYHTAFAGPGIPHDRFPRMSEGERKTALALCIGYLTLALAGGSRVLLRLRDEATLQVKKVLGVPEAAEPWPALASGLYLLPELLGKDEISQSLAVYLSSASAAVLRAWFTGKSVSKPLSLLRCENLGLGLIMGIHGQRPRDLLDLLIGVRLRSAGESFQRETQEALMRMSEDGDVTILGEVLQRHARESILSYPLPGPSMARLMLRLLTRFRSESPDMIRLTAAAYMALRDAFREAEAADEEVN